jgi:predicted MPP superfamily phosphohydrolase
MEIKFVHLSDIHFSPGGHESRPAFAPFLRDLEEQQKETPGPVYLVLSGDLAHAGGSMAHYESLIEKLGPALDRAGIPKGRRICVPGNHDVSTAVVEASLQDHEAIVGRNFNEQTFNDYLLRPGPVFKEKFDNYLRFQEEFSAFGINGDLIGAGHSLPEGMGVYCANTAFFSSGAAKLDGKKLDDKGRLGLPTRSIAQWLNESSHKVRILACHHPADWLNQWSQVELRRISRSFSVIFSGHLHVQDIHHSVEFGSNTVHLCAPALLTHKRDPMGYAISTICTERGALSVKYRQWSNRSKFVLGTLMADSDEGVVDLTVGRAPAHCISTEEDVIVRYFDAGLERALKAYGKDLKVWIEPTLKRVSETDRDRSKKDKIEVGEIVSSDSSIFVKAPPQYGLTCLGWMMCREAMRSCSQALWLRVDLAITKPHKVRDELQALLKTFDRSKESVACVVVDSWNSSSGNAKKCLEAIIKDFPLARLIVLETQDRPSLDASFAMVAGRTFEQIYLWALPRSGLRKFVGSYYSQHARQSEVELALGKVISDLEALNLPRTALNCLTLLMVSDVEYDDTPINRAEVIRRILFLLFSSDSALTYKTRADIKDGEHLLGYFAEQIIRSGEADFTREHFVLSGARFCKEMLVDIDVRAVLGLLIENGVIVEDDGMLRFRFSYWVYYFAASRMHHDANFASYVLTDMQYTRFPEVIEFYTGIDRRRADAIERLTGDLTALCNQVEAKCGLSTPSELYSAGRWDPTEADVQKMRAELEEKVLGSTLPDEIKDQFADRTYDVASPYDQQIRSVMTAYSFDNLCAGVRAGSRALRNSDYVNPELKKQLLSAIMRCWEQIQTVAVLVAPALAHHGRASFDGTNFIVDEVLRDEAPTDASVGKIWSFIPYNVLMWFRGDLSSAKMGPLLFSALGTESGALARHNLAMLVAAIRPQGWRRVLEDYIAEVDKNSFFLWDAYTSLWSDFRVGVLQEKMRVDVSDLVKMSVAKHETGNKRPGSKLIAKVMIDEDGNPDSEES